MTLADERSPGRNDDVVSGSSCSVAMVADGFDLGVFVGIVVGVVVVVIVVVVFVLVRRSIRVPLVVVVVANVITTCYIISQC